MFIRGKLRNGTTYYEVVHSRRNGNSVVQGGIVSLGLSPTVNGAIQKTDQELHDVIREWRRQFGDAAPTDVNDDAAIATTTATMPKTLARRFRQRVATIRRLTEMAARLREAAKALGEPTLPADTATDFAEMKKICPVWGTW